LDHHFALTCSALNDHIALESISLNDDVALSALTLNHEGALTLNDDFFFGGFLRVRKVDRGDERS
jgi:hypothetical protein